MVKTWNEKLFHIDGAKVTNYYFPLKLHKNEQSQKLARSLSLASIGPELNKIAPAGEARQRSNVIEFETSSSRKFYAVSNP